MAQVGKALWSAGSLVDAGMSRSVGMLGAGTLGALAVFLSSGCALFTSVDAEFLSNAPLLDRAAAEAGYRVDSQWFALTAVDLRDDSVTFQYRGVAHVGDAAWVVRFSQKTTEQDPVALGETHALLPVVAEGRRNFSVVGEGQEMFGANSVGFVRYRFDSNVRDRSGEPLLARGILAVVSQQRGGYTVVYRIKIDNYGDRDHLNWEDLRPFLEALP